MHELFIQTLLKGKSKHFYIYLSNCLQTTYPLIFYSFILLLAPNKGEYQKKCGVTKVYTLWLHISTKIIDNVWEGSFSEVSLVFSYEIATWGLFVMQEYDSELPESLSEFRSPPSPPSSYDNKCLNEDDFSRPPPETPAQLQSTILNNESSSSYDGQQPQHSELNHLYIQNHFEGQFVALGSTRRFRQKYVTMVLYKPLRRTN